MACIAEMSLVSSVIKSVVMAKHRTWTGSSTEQLLNILAHFRKVLVTEVATLPTGMAKL